MARILGHVQQRLVSHNQPARVPSGQQIATGKAISVMVNGGKAQPGYAGRFREVQESAVFGQ